MAMRGDLVTVAMAGDFGKPRPALVVQSDQFSGHPTITVLLLSSTPIDAPLVRLAVDPSPQNGLRKVSFVQVDKAMTIRRDKIGETIGHLDDATMIRVNRAMAVFLGIA
jgi:mRNA interferase MazF